jgi:hypothetical protein
MLVQDEVQALNERHWAQKSWHSRGQKSYGHAALVLR